MDSDSGHAKSAIADSDSYTRERFVHLSVRIEWEIIQKLKQEARVRKVSLSALARQLLRSCLSGSSGLPSEGSESFARGIVPQRPQPSPGLSSGLDPAEGQHS